MTIDTTNPQGSYGEQQRQLKILRILEILKRICPIKFEKAVSHSVFETGLREVRVRETFKHLYNLEKIEIDENTNIISIPEGKDEINTA